MSMLSDSSTSIPTMNSSPYGSLDDIPPSISKPLIECHDELNLTQLRCCRDFFQSKIDKFQHSLEEGITIDQFEKIKKEDGDGDQEEGESTY